jgi:hypothetical protein
MMTKALERKRDPDQVEAPSTAAMDVTNKIASSASAAS